MYVKQHNNVTILYADVVNFSKLTVSMTVKKLVETLNELFSKFDQASEVCISQSLFYNNKVPSPNKVHLTFVSLFTTRVNKRSGNCTVIVL